MHLQGKRKARFWRLWIALPAFIVLTMAGCHQVKEEAQVPRAGKTEPARLFTHKVIENGKTFGYEVHFDGRPIIRQKTIPGMAGNKGFADSATAARVAELVSQKLASGTTPPTVSRQELDSLNALSAN